MKVIVIGCGLIGVTTAYFLNKLGVDVMVIDRAESAGMETSFANGGLLTAGMSDPWNAPGVFQHMIKWIGKEDAPIVLRLHALPSLIGWGFLFLRNASPERFHFNLKKNAVLSCYSLNLLCKLREEIGIDYAQSSVGAMKIFRESDELQAVAKLAKEMEQYEVEHHILDRDGVIQIEPALKYIANEIEGGIYYPNDESGDSYLFCKHLQEICQSNGVIFHFNSCVKKLIYDGRIINSVITDNHQFQANKFVVAAGSYSPALVDPLGIHLPVKPAKGYSITIQRGDWPQGPQIPVIDDNLHAAVVPVGEHLRVAGTAEFCGFEPSISQGRIDNLMKLLLTIYPEFSTHYKKCDITSWMGFRPMSADCVPIMGKTRINNLIISTGHGHLGWTMAAGSGKLLADLIVGSEPEIQLDDYSIERFS